jgi:hypothetical protein
VMQSPGVGLAEGERAKIALQTHMKPNDDRYSPPPGHKEGTCQDDPILVVLADQWSSICYVPLLGVRDRVPHGDPLWNPHLTHHTFTNNTAAHTFIYFAGRNSHSQRRSFHPAEGRKVAPEIAGRRSSLKAKLPHQRTLIEL